MSTLRPGPKLDPVRNRAGYSCPERFVVVGLPSWSARVCLVMTPGKGCLANGCAKLSSYQTLSRGATFPQPSQVPLPKVSKSTTPRPGSLLPYTCDIPAGRCQWCRERPIAITTPNGYKLCTGCLRKWRKLFTPAARRGRIGSKKD